MYGRRFRGGADVDYESVLGDNFRNFMGILNESGIKGFTKANYGQGNSSMQDTDVIPVFMDNVIAITRALAKLEKPTPRPETNEEINERKKEVILQKLNEMPFEEPGEIKFPYHKNFTKYIARGAHIKPFEHQNESSLNIVLKYLIKFYSIQEESSNITNDSSSLLIYNQELSKHLDKILDAIGQDKNDANKINLLNHLSSELGEIIEQHRNINADSKIYPNIENDGLKTMGEENEDEDEDEDKGEEDARTTGTTATDAEISDYDKKLMENIKKLIEEYEKNKETKETKETMEKLQGLKDLKDDVDKLKEKLKESEGIDINTETNTDVIDIGENIEEYVKTIVQYLKIVEGEEEEEEEFTGGNRYKMMYGGTRQKYSLQRQRKQRNQSSKRNPRNQNNKRKYMFGGANDLKVTNLISELSELILPENLLNLIKNNNNDLINGLYNPGFLDVRMYSDKYQGTFAQVPENLQKGGADDAIPMDSNTVNSLPFLYYEEDGDYKLITEILNEVKIDEIPNILNKENAASIMGMLDFVFIDENYNNLIDSTKVDADEESDVSVGDTYNITYDFANDMISHIKKYRPSYAKSIKIINESIESRSINNIKDQVAGIIAQHFNLPEQMFPSTPSQSRTQKPTLADEKIWKFYKNVVLQHSQFYNRYFNLVNLENPSQVSQLNEAANASVTDRSKYRLNVKKNTGNDAFTNVQEGGAPEDETVVVRQIMSAIRDTEGVTGIYLGDQLIPKDNIENVVTQTVQQAYRGDDTTPQIRIRVSPPATIGATGATGTPRDITIDVTNVINRTTTNPITPDRVAGVNQRSSRSDSGRNQTNQTNQTRQSQSMKRLIANLHNIESNVNKPTWKEGEVAVSEHIMRQRSKWELQDGNFVKLDDQGNPIENIEDSFSCNFFAEQRRCKNFLKSCLAANGFEQINTECKKILNTNFNFSNSGTQAKIDAISKINPVLAYGILHKFGFGYKIVDNDPYPFIGFRRNKVQSVSSWLKELNDEINGNTCNNNTVRDSNTQACKKITDLIGNDLGKSILRAARNENRHQFFDYLDILVNWVNANPQVLNKEMVVNPRFKRNFPEPSKEFQIFDHINPHQAINKLHDTSCGLERLKADIINDLSGAKVSTTVSDIVQMPAWLQTPFNRNAFVTTSPISGFGIIQRGGIFATMSELEKLHEPQGHKLLSDIYADIENTMANMTGTHRTELSKKTREHIKNKLESFREEEYKLREALKTTIEQNKLYQASRGNVNPYGDNYAAVLAKHSNLLHHGSSYNRKAINLIDVFQSISKALIEKISDDNRGQMQR